MKTFTDTDRARMGKAINHARATAEERDFLAAMISLSLANEPVSAQDYTRASTLAAINLHVEPSIFDRQPEITAPFTPGPWRIKQSAVGLLITMGRGITTICNVHPRSAMTANATLIAAAPEMLDALKECVLVMERDLNGLAVIQPELAKARAAIANATGD